MCKTFLLDHYSKCAFDNLLHFDKNKSLEKQRFYAVSKAFQAGDERIELPPKVLETPIIPLDQSPVCTCALDIYTIPGANLSIINRKNPRFIFLKRLFVDFSTSVEYNNSTDVEFVFQT